MKVVLSKNGDDFSVYVPKKDLEESVTEFEPEGVFGGTFTLGNGWKLYLAPMDAEPKLPMTMEMKKLS